MWPFTTRGLSAWPLPVEKHPIPAGHPYVCGTGTAIIVGSTWSCILSLYNYALPFSRSSTLLFFGVYFHEHCHLLPWKIRRTSVEVNQLPWKLPPASMQVNLRPFTSTEVAMEVALFSSFIYFHESFHQGQIPCK